MAKEPRVDSYVLKSVTLVGKMNIFGIHSDQLSATMSGLKLEADGDKVIVTHDATPNKREVIHANGIAKTVWERLT